MNIFGMGPLELLLILILALIIFGPNDIQKAGKTIGQSLSKIVRSDAWRAITQTSQEFKNMPTKLIREAGLEEQLHELQKTAVQPVNEIGRDLQRMAAEAQKPGGTHASEPAAPDSPPGSEAHPEEDTLK